MLNLGFTELVIVILVVSVLFFGGKRVTELGRSLGRFSGEFKKGQAEVKKELDEMGKEVKKEL